MNTSHSSRRPTRRERHYGLKRSLSTLAGMFEDDVTTASPQQVIGDSSAPADSMLRVISEKNGYFPIDECQDSELLLIARNMHRNQHKFEEEPSLQSMWLPSVIMVPRPATSLPPSCTLLRTTSFDEEADERAAVVAKRNLSISSEDSFVLYVDDDDADNKSINGQELCL